MEQLKSSSLIVSIEPTGATDTKGIWTISIQTQKLNEAQAYIVAKVGIKNLEQPAGLFFQSQRQRMTTTKRYDSIGSYASILKNMTTSIDNSTNTSNSHEFDNCMIHNGRRIPSKIVLNNTPKKSKPDNITSNNTSTITGTKPEMHPLDITRVTLKLGGP